MGKRAKRSNRSIKWHVGPSVGGDYPLPNRELYALVEQDIPDPEQPPMIIRLYYDDYGYVRNLTEPGNPFLEGRRSVVRWRYCNGDDD